MSPGLALLAAIIICGGVTYYFLRPAAPGDEAPAAGAAPTAVEPSASESGATPDAAAVGAAAPSAPGSRSKSEAEALAYRRIHGTVTDEEDAALAGMALRWLPVGERDLRRYSHDSRALGRSAAPSRVPDGPIRDALARSEVTTSAEDGRYELRVPLAGAAGVVVVSGPGYEMQIRSADPAQLPRVVAEPEESAAARASEAEAPADVEIDFRLGAASSISGKVTDAESGDVVPGMTVVAGVVDPGAPAMMSFVDRDAPSSVVDAEGTYLLEGLKPGDYRVLPRTGDSDYVAFATREAAKVELEAGIDVTNVDFEVARGARIFGRITDSEDRPVAGADCKVLPADMLAASMRGDMDTMLMLDSRAKRSDPDGYYEVRGVARGGRYRVAVDADDFAAAQSDVFEAAEESIEVNVSLTIGSVISGYVLSADGDPAPDTPVSVIPDLQKIMAGNYAQVAERQKTKTDATGAFRLEHFGAGEYRLQPGRINPQELWSSQDKGTVVEVDGIHDVTDVTLTLPGGESGGLAGIVTDDEGTPIEGASIQIMKPEDFMGASPTRLTTGADGRFIASELEGATFRIGASKAGYSSVRLNDVALGSEGVEIVLERHGRVSGRVITLAGVSLAPGGKVEARKSGGTSFLEDMQRMMPGGRGADVEVPLNPDGTFSIDAPAGAVEILASVPMFAPAVSPSITVSPGEEVTGVKILVTSGAVIQGRVTLAGMEAIQGAAVTVTPLNEDSTGDLMSELMPQMFARNRNQATTDGDGRFEVLHLAPGRYRVLAAHRDYAPSDPLTLTLAQDQVRDIGELPVTVGGTLHGVVRRADAPQPGLMVQLMGEGPIQQSTTAADGTFEFRGLRTGDYIVNVVDLAAMQRGTMSLKTRPASVQDEQVTELEVIFGVGSKVRGKVAGLAPAPMRMVTLRRPGGPAPEDIDPTDVQGGIAAAKYQAGTGMIAPDGQYAIEDVDPGEYILEIPRMPSDLTDMEAYRTMDRTPQYRKKIKVGKEDVELDIVVK